MYNPLNMFRNVQAQNSKWNQITTIFNDRQRVDPIWHYATDQGKERSIVF